MKFYANLQEDDKIDSWNVERGGKKFAINLVCIIGDQAYVVELNSYPKIFLHKSLSSYEHMQWWIKQVKAKEVFLSDSVNIGYCLTLKS